MVEFDGRVADGDATACMDGVGREHDRGGERNVSALFETSPTVEGVDADIPEEQEERREEEEGRAWWGGAHARLGPAAMTVVDPPRRPGHTRE